MADAPADASGERHGLEEQRAERLARVEVAAIRAVILVPLLRPEGGT